MFKRLAIATLIVASPALAGIFTVRAKADETPSPGVSDPLKEDFVDSITCM
jgi:hypothetical protein